MGKAPSVHASMPLLPSADEIPDILANGNTTRNGNLPPIPMNSDNYSTIFGLLHEGHFLIK
jgi:hypothetical protein